MNSPRQSANDDSSPPSTGPDAAQKTAPADAAGTQADGAASPEGEVVSAQAAAPEPSEQERLQARVTELEGKLNATLMQYKEALDGFEAAKTRIKRELTGEIAKGRRELVVPLLDVLDNLDRALESSNAGADDALHKGVSMVREQFMQRLVAQGLRRLQAMGQPFNPTHFEAISTVPVTKPEQDGTVVGVVREAYVMGDETVRHGLVAVGKYAGE